MQLKGNDFELLQDALVDAFDSNALQIMVRTGLDQDPETIFPTGDKKVDQVYKLLRWSEKQNRMQDLIAAARAKNPSNTKLQEAEAVILSEEYVKPGTRATILFDQTHGQNKWTPIPPTVGRGYQAIANDLKDHYEVKRLNPPDTLDEQALEGVDVLVLGIGPAGRCQLRSQEMDVINNFVEDGGGLLVLGDYTGDSRHEANLNQLIGYYGIAFVQDIVVPSSISVGMLRTREIELESDHVVTALAKTICNDYNEEDEATVIRSALLDGIEQVAILTACSLSVNPAEAITLLCTKLDESYTFVPAPFVGADIWNLIYPEAMPLIAVNKSVKVVVAGSRKMFLNDFVKSDDFDNKQLAHNIIRWLAEKPS